MPFGTTVAGDVFQYKLDQCFGHIPNVIVIAEDIMAVGKMQNHKDHDQALTTLLQTAKACNVRLNYENLQYKQTEVESFWRNIHSKWLQASTKQGESNCWNATTKLQETSTVLYRHGELLTQVFCPLVWTCRTHLGSVKRKGSIQLETWTWRVFQACKEGDCKCTNSSMLHPRKSTVL